MSIYNMIQILRTNITKIPWFAILIEVLNPRRQEWRINYGRPLGLYSFRITTSLRPNQTNSQPYTQAHTEGHGSASIQGSASIHSFFLYTNAHRRPWLGLYPGYGIRCSSWRPLLVEIMLALHEW